ncbi:MAG: hypothetical protein KatS3mg031_0856 [Chitinophagales bacterium]|nr:MAG: hypothetical protein KatS3mg031_0856 [Chitinophagales bacterium]
MRNPEDSNFCYYPFFQILVTAEGKYKPCSKHDDHIQHKGRILTTKNATLEDAWNSDYMQQMRHDFNHGILFPGCAECWRMQKMGLRSMRYDSYQYGISEEQVANPVNPTRIEINSSNVCNLKCRICTPTASSKWIKEGKDLYAWNQKIHDNLNGKNLEQIKRWAPNLTELCFFGGEPLLSEENLILLDYLIREGYAKNIALLFNTNGTVFNEEIEARLLPFKRVRFHFSIDDIGKRFEYQRYGASWKTVEENLHKVYRQSMTPAWKHIEFKICCTVSTLNIYYFPEFFTYLNTHLPGLKVLWNLLYDPWEFSVQVLPPQVKEIVRQRLLTIRPSYTLSEGETKTMETLIKYLEHQVHKPFEEFFRLVNRHDVYRKESFAETFPEFYQIIQKYKPANLTPGGYDQYDLIQQRMLTNISQYKYLNYFENLRDTVNLTEPRDTETWNELSHVVLQALREIAAEINRDTSFEIKMHLLKELLEGHHFNQRDFLHDCCVYGLFRIYKSLCDISSAEINSLLLRKYPADMQYKYVN